MMRDLPTVDFEIALAVAIAIAVLMFLIPRREPLFRPKSIGFGWTPNDWQGWVLMLTLIIGVGAAVRLVLGVRGG